ncbi:MAG: hypothetical protein ABIK44_07950, partial [candidate division WOR-3 bacterium]
EGSFKPGPCRCHRARRQNRGQRGKYNTLIVWDLATGKPLRTLKGHTDSVRAVAIAPDGRTAVSGSDDNTLIVWDLATGKPLMRFALVAPVSALSLSRNRLVVGLPTGDVEFFELVNLSSTGTG